MNLARYLIALSLLLISFSSSTQSQSFPDDFSMREEAAQRIAANHGIRIDWQGSTLLQIMDAEARLDTVKRLRQHHGVEYDWRKFSLMQLMDAETRMDAAKRISRATGKTVDWEKYSLMELMQMDLRASGLNTGAAQRVGDSRTPGSVAPARGLVRASSNDSRDEIQAEVEGLSWEIQKLRRNAEDYDPDDYARKLKRLEWELEDLSGRAEDVGAEDAATSFEDAGWDVRKLRRDVENSSRYFYGERNDDINRRLKRVEWDTKDALFDLEE